jgi:hypothetical protein
MKFGTSFKAEDGIPNVITEQRSSTRIHAAYPARLWGSDRAGQTFKEDTLLENLSGGGVYLRLRKMIQVGSDVVLAARLSTAPVNDVSALRLAARGTVLRIDPQPDGSYGVAIEFKRRRVL